MAYRKTTDVRSILYAAVCLALALVLPLITGNIPTLGKQFAPMHFPVLLCGFLCGPVWGAAVGGVAPILRFLIFGVPALYPNALLMTAELLVYGLASGLFYRYLPKRPLGIFASLLCAQFFGRLAWGLGHFLLCLFDSDSTFYLEAVITATVSGSLYGIFIQLLLIPPIVLAMQKARYISRS